MTRQLPPQWGYRVSPAPAAMKATAVSLCNATDNGLVQGRTPVTYFTCEALLYFFYLGLLLVIGDWDVFFSVSSVPFEERPDSIGCISSLEFSCA